MMPLNTVSDVLIRPAEGSDLPEMFIISILAHRSSYQDLIPLDGRNRFNKRYTATIDNQRLYIKNMTPKVRNTSWRLWVAEVQGRIVGYTLGEIVSETYGRKHGLFVDPDYQGLGIGSSLLKQSLSIIPRGIIELTVIENNMRAKALYEKIGFHIVGRDTGSYYGAYLDIMQLVKLDEKRNL